MALKEKKSKIPSLVIDTEFLRRLGEILEREINQRVLTYQELLESTPASERWKIKEPRCSIQYEFESDNESIKFEAVDEILSTHLLPRSINSLDIYLYHYDSQFVDAHFRISNGIFGNEFKLSSGNESSLLKIDHELRSLFGEFQTTYHSLLYPWGSRSITTTLALLFGLAATYEVWITAQKAFDINGGILSLLSGFLLFCFFATGQNFIGKLYPYYEFDLWANPPLTKNLRIFLWLVFIGIISAALYGLLS